MLQGVPAGKITLLVLALGLLSYGLYKAGSALFDGDGDGTSVKGVAKRIGRAGGGLIYLASCWAAVRLAVVIGALNTQRGSREAAAKALQLPLGSLVLASVGAQTYLPEASPQYPRLHLRRRARRHGSCSQRRGTSDRSYCRWQRS